MSKMTVLEIRGILALLWYEWEKLACNCVNRTNKRGHDHDCAVTLRSHMNKQISRAIARLDEIAQKGL